MNISSSDEYKEAYDLYFGCYNSLESNEDLGKKAYEIAERIYEDSLDDCYVKASTAFALLKSLHKIGFPYKLNLEERDKLIEKDQAGLATLGLSSSDLNKRKKIFHSFFKELDEDVVLELCVSETSEGFALPQPCI